MQLMAKRGLEHGETKGFGWIDGDVDAIEPRDPCSQDSAYGLEHARCDNVTHALLDGIALGLKAATPISFTPIIWRS